MDKNGKRKEYAVQRRKNDRRNGVGRNDNGAYSALGDLPGGKELQEEGRQRMRVKMDLNVLEDKIIEVINRSKSKFCQTEGTGICIGLDILNSYLTEVAKRVIKIDDPILLYNLMQIGVIKPDNEEEAKSITERAEKIRESEK